MQEGSFLDSILAQKLPSHPKFAWRMAANHNSVCPYFWERDSAFKRDHSWDVQSLQLSKFWYPPLSLEERESLHCLDVLASSSSTQSSCLLLRSGQNSSQQQSFSHWVWLITSTSLIFSPSLLGVCTDKSFCPKVLSCWNKGSLCIFSAHVYFFFKFRVTPRDG